MSNTKAFIDYTLDDNGSSAREALYSEIHNRVMAHIEAKKIELAGGMLTREESHCDMDDKKEKIAKKEMKIAKLKEELAIMEASMCDSKDDEDDDSEYENKKKKLKKAEKKLKKLKESLEINESDEEGEIDETGEWSEEDEEDELEVSEEQ